MRLPSVVTVSLGCQKGGGDQHIRKVQSNPCVWSPALNARSDSDCLLTLVGWLHDAEGPRPSLSLVTV